jgi:hypothetical protein
MKIKIHLRAAGENTFIFFFLIFFMVMTGMFQAAPAQTLTADAILDKVDRNAIPGTKIVLSEMVVHGRRDSRTIKAKSWIKHSPNTSIRRGRKVLRCSSSRTGCGLTRLQRTES